ncbi:bifunctional tetrahydrofolate synthase/dihydrofolate synthase [Legionella bononiensis]|uniref:Dihydrofolate synthase/folylpolyglutamate synthase n=1 Tax=Legionella bononiensis TaxID=2793102 RepID=A0ABS1WBK0_9GAMM|nr:bifunctional tetrahydrofolate synthase/dihydrofolate synthase [Legionella bononiensis]MBL7481019.1 bifunctional tetrahydrofolate synthase/dihydrofolate synthase [Legionella bononiensis]MBL7526727.1 bifunctional tetrahydrofolate synthase/dihydrofolate synthase [Legionella bononiensis]MBL7564134.1 bifunctional tetrahydrofolate synthase/dihydrofolate synthase [Legionella bononiensis]
MHNPLSEWDLNHWLSSLESRHTQEIQLGLTRIKAVAKKLNLLAPDCKIITVAGTNGKGSTVTALETIYHTAGYRVGAYTSPHLLQFNERIRVNLKPIPDNELCHAFCVIEEGRGEVNLTYFEMTTLAALWYFKNNKLDVLILEVGLGGRMDATNILDADLAVITTIDYDHQEFLGTTLDAIGYEKAGILRPKKPFVYADENPPASILNVAKDFDSPTFLYSRNFSFQRHESNWSLNFMGRTISELPIPCIQLKSASAAISACLLLEDDLPVSHEQYRAAMKTVFLPGRLQLQQRGSVRILYDVSHNPQSARLLADRMKQLDTNTRVHAVFSALKDKDIFGLIFPLRDCVDRWYPAQLDNKRAASADLLLAQFKGAEIIVDVCYNTPLLAFEQALNQAEAGDLIVVYGSFFTVSQVMAAQHNILEQKEIQ